MKNLITKAIGIAGITALSFLPMNGKGQDNLKEYNKENEQVYGNFNEFLKANGEKTPHKNSNKLIKAKIEDVFYFSKYKYEVLIKNKKYTASFDDNDKFLLKIYEADSSLAFEDANLNGLDKKDLFEKYIYSGDSAKEIGEFPEENQLSLAKEYTNALKEIMHDAKYKNY